MYSLLLLQASIVHCLIHSSKSLKTVEKGGCPTSISGLIPHIEIAKEWHNMHFNKSLFIYLLDEFDVKYGREK